ncbi:MAG: OmpH family outer membrane protein [Planctomycetaceae bacterium]|nr:OmpH family outer membrane protein [Planctomycetaceae bacterium]
MKRIIFSLVLLVLASPLAVGQTPQPAAGQAPAKHQVGLIDMAHIFKNYQKFTTLTESLQSEIQKADEQGQQLVEQIKTQQQVLTSGNLVEGSPEFAAAEAKLLEMQTSVQTFQRKNQRDFLKKEADIYKTVYLEVEDAVGRYAQYYNYTLILRFNRQSVDSAENPREIITGMNRQVVYYRTSDDITDRILEFLNSEWQAKQTRSAERP